MSKTRTRPVEKPAAISLRLGWYATQLTFSPGALNSKSCSKLRNFRIHRSKMRFLESQPRAGMGRQLRGASQGERTKWTGGDPDPSHLLRPHTLMVPSSEAVANCSRESSTATQLTAPVWERSRVV